MKSCEVFEMYPDAHWLAMDMDKSAHWYKLEPMIYHVMPFIWSRYIGDMGNINEGIDEFANKPWTDCKISRAEALQEDCCEWDGQESEKTDGNQYFTSCHFSHYFRRKGTPKSYCFTYCPYCGKLIKEVTK